MKHGFLGLAVIIALAGGCAPDPPDPVELQVGAQRISVVIPVGWEHIDYGDRHQLRHGLARISIEDSGGAPDKALRRLGENEQRDVASRTPLEIDSHQGEIVDTWDRLSHQHRRRFCFVQGNGPMLVIYTMPGEFDTVQPVFDALIASVALVDSVAQAVGEAQAQ